MFKDALYGLRSLARNPGVTAVALLTLTLGIGANTAVFSVVNAVLLRPLPYRDADRLVTIRAQIPSFNISRAFLEYNTYADWFRARSHSFQSISAFTPGSATLTMGDETERLPVFRVSAGSFSVVGVPPVLGRDFQPDEDQPGGPHVVILSNELWKRRFGGDRGIIGRTIVLDRESYAVVGVLPPKFELYGGAIQAYKPIAAPIARVRGMPTVGVFARLKPGVSVKAAQSEIDALCRGWVEQYHYPKDWGARVHTVRDFFVGDLRPSVLAVAIAVGLVLLIACVNVANMLLARAGARRREMAVRAALGASTGRIVRQLLTESGLLATVASGMGLLAAWVGARAFAAADTTYLPFQQTVSIDGATLGFTLFACLATILLFGLAPAMASAKVRLSENLAEGARNAGQGLVGRRLRAGLVIAEVALALVLGIGATLTVSSLERLLAVDPGFNSNGILKADVNLPPENYPDAARRKNFFEALTRHLGAAPGVTSVGLTSHLPFSQSKSGSDIVPEGAPQSDTVERNIAFIRSVDPNYFRTMQVRLLAGRAFEPRDPVGDPVAIINDKLARRCWPGQTPLGKRFTMGRNGSLITVVGVIADMRQSSLAEEPDLEVYTPYAQGAGSSMAIVARTSGDPTALVPTMRAAVRELDKTLVLVDAGPLNELVSRSTRSRRFSVALLASFAGLALLLAAVGVYGVVSYSVTRRRHEIGVRMALGAGRGRITGMVVREAALLGGAGVAVGFVGSLAATRLLRSMLFGVSPTDPAVFAGVSLFLIAVAAAAGFIPALRAASVDPGRALRHQ